MRSGSSKNKSSKPSSGSSKTSRSPTDSVKKDLKGKENPVWRPENEKMEDTEYLLYNNFYDQLKKLRTSRRSSLVESSSSSQSDVNEFGHWVCLWGNKSTSGAAHDSGILNLGRIIGKEFVIDSAIKASKLIEENLSYRWDWDDTKGKHFNTTELFLVEPTQASTPKFNEAFEKAYVYTKKIEYVFFKNVPDPTPDEKLWIDEYIKNSQPEVDEGMTSLTNRELRKGAIMPCDVARKFLKALTSHQDHLISYFMSLKSSLRPLVNAARIGYLKNDGEFPIDKDEHHSQALNELIQNYLLEEWKPVISEILNKIKESTISPLSNDETIGELILEHSKINHAIPIFLNEIDHALHSAFSREILLTNLIKMLAGLEPKHIVTEFFDLLKSSQPADKVNLEVFEKLVLDRDYRKLNFPKIVNMPEPQLQTSHKNEKKGDDVDLKSEADVSSLSRPKKP